jgi:hypothetical protein
MLTEFLKSRQKHRAFVDEDLQAARHDFESLQPALIEKGHDDLTCEAQAAVESIIAMHEMHRVSPTELQKLDDLYGTLLSALAFG